MARQPYIAKNNEDLLRDFDEWLAMRGGTATLGDVLATGDTHLFAAFVLRRFRVAARNAVFDRIRREATSAGLPEPTGSISALLFMADRVGDAWKLNGSEKTHLFGLETAAELETLCNRPEDVPPEMLERAAILLDIFAAINVLLPRTERADAWIRSPNTAELFGGKSALRVMLDGGLREMHRVRAYVQAEAAGN